MRTSKKIWAILAASGATVVASVGVCVYVLMQDASRADDADLSMSSESRAVAVRADEAVRVGVGSTSERAWAGEASEGSKDGTDASVAAGPTEEEDERLMNEVVKELMAQLTEACKSRDYKRVLALADKLRALNYGATRRSSARASSTKRAVLTALSELGAAGIGPIIDLVGDSDPFIAKEATSLVFEALLDLSLNDHMRADIVVATCEEMTDPNSLARLYTEFIRMRHSVGADALSRIAVGGTEEAKAELPRVIGAFTSNLEITEVSQLNDWLQENPDSPNDEWYYGPIVKDASSAK